MNWQFNALAALLFSTLAACSSASDSLCDDIGDCRTLSSDQVASCQREARALSAEAGASACGTQAAAWFACAGGRYECRGNVPTYSGCDPARSALDSCLARARATNSCGALASGLAACPGATSTSDPAAPPPPCGAAEVCASRCYLDSVGNLCAPTPLQLSLAAQCTATCPG